MACNRCILDKNVLKCSRVLCVRVKSAIRSRILCSVWWFVYFCYKLNSWPMAYVFASTSIFLRKLRLEIAPPPPTPTHALKSELCSRVNNNNLSISTTEKTNESPASERDSNPLFQCFYGCKFSRAPFWISESVLLYIPVNMNLKRAKWEEESWNK